MEPVGKLLSDKGIAFKVSGRDYVIKCLNPEHDDSNPSLRVDKVSGLAHCFSCGWKHNLFKFYNVDPPLTSIKLLKLKEKLTNLKRVNDLQMLEGARPVRNVFRGISIETLTKFEAFYTDSIQSMVDRIVFPIRNISGRITFFIGRYVNSDAPPKYLMYPEHSYIGCFPEKIDREFTSIVLVEGLFDFLNLYDKGIKNAVCMFGIQALKYNISAKLQLYKAQGVHKIFLMLDGDTAGRTAATELQPLIEAEDFVVEIINLPDDEDPGSLSQEDVNTIKEYIK
jgi:DNA primase